MLLSVTVCQFVLRYAFNLDMDETGVNFFVRLYAAAARIISRRTTSSFWLIDSSLKALPLCQNRTFRLLQKLGVITENGEMGLLDRVVHPRTSSNPNPISLQSSARKSCPL